MRKWLSGLAIWAVVGSAAALAIYGHLVTLGPLAAFAVPITIGIEIYAARGARHLVDAPNAQRRVAIAGLIALCAIVSGVFEHRGFQSLNAVSNAEYNAADSERAAALETLALLGPQFNALPQMPTDAAALASMSTRALDRIERVRAQWDADNGAAYRNAQTIAARPLPARKADPLNEASIWLIVGFVLVIKLFGFWAISPPPAQVVQLRDAKPAPVAPQPPAQTAGQALAAKRWANKKAAQAEAQAAPAPIRAVG